MTRALEPAKSEALDEAEVEGATTNWPDEASETAFRAESRDRNEADVSSGAPVGATEETDTKPLPALNDLVKRISPEARELLDELFRAKFTTVKRVPAKSLKS